MEKKSKKSILIGITSLFLVMLILVGLTYAYYRTRIIGNESEDPSISVTSKKLEIVYADQTANITADNFEPGKTYTKTFTVTNTGDGATDYSVILENVAITYASDGTDINGLPVSEGNPTELIHNDDVLLKITCESSVDGNTCNGNGTDGTYPRRNDILLTNTIEAEETQTYTVTLTYVDDGDQSADMNKKIEGKFNIIDTKNTMDIEGKVFGYEDGDYIQVNSEKKVSAIYAGTYKLVGLEPGNHNIKLCGKDVVNCTEENAKISYDFEVSIGNNSFEEVSGKGYISSANSSSNERRNAVMNIDNNEKDVIISALLDNETAKKMLVEIEWKPEYAIANNGLLSREFEKLPDNGTAILTRGNYYIDLYASETPKNLTIIGGEGVIVDRIYHNFEDHERVFNGLTLHNLTFSGENEGIYLGGIFKNLTISNCYFPKGTGFAFTSELGATEDHENIVIKNNIFTGTQSNLSHIFLKLVKNATISNNIIDGGRNGIQVSWANGVINIANNVISNTSDAAFRFGTIGENATINVIGNAISNAVKPSTGAIARIGDNSDLPASSMVTFNNNTYNGAIWKDTTWSNVTGEFGINSAGEKVAS